MIRNKNIVYNSRELMIPVTLNFGDYLMEKLWRYRNNVCMINGATDERITYGEIAQQAMNIAVSLTRMGVRKGEVVALMSENRSEFYPAAIGAICAGAVLTTINIGYTKGELLHVLSISKPSYIFCSPLTYKSHEKTLHSLKHLKKIIVFGDRIPNTVTYNVLAFPRNNNVNTELFDENNELLRNVKYEEFEVADVMGQTDTLVILYSSGTTGLPKGVMLTHVNVLAACCLPPSHDPTKLGLTITPWYHVMGLVGNFTAMVTGRAAVYLAKFEVDLFLRTIEKYKTVQITLVPPVCVAVCKSDAKYDLSTVKLIYSGAAPLHKDTVQSLKIKFPNAVILQGYGMTEATLSVIRDTFDKAEKSKPGSVGYALASCVVKVVDIKTGETLGPNKTGEICIKGPLIMKGYIGRGSEGVLDEQGFFKSGDIGYYDEDQCFFIVDRLKELIKYKGYQVPPAEIEAILLQHPAVKDVGVVGKDHGDAGEVPVAFVVVQPGGAVTEEELKKFVAERLSNPKHLRGGVRFVDQIPKNPSGKILRKVMREMIKKEKSKL